MFVITFIITYSICLHHDNCFVLVGPKILRKSNSIADILYIGCKAYVLAKYVAEFAQLKAKV